MRDCQHQECRGARHAVHQTDQQCAPAKAVLMNVGGPDMQRGFAGMAMNMNMQRAVGMAVPVKMYAVAQQPPQHWTRGKFSSNRCIRKHSNTTCVKSARNSPSVVGNICICAVRTAPNMAPDP